MLTEAVTSNPPLLSPQAANVDRSEIPIEINVSAAAIKSWKRFLTLRYRPASRQSRPSSPPPLTCATA
eukprot:Skav226315  [mRNA]  locus=scaffold3301:597735:598214:+ [translate_table: standard]